MENDRKCVAKTTADGLSYELDMRRDSGYLYVSMMYRLEWVERKHKNGKPIETASHRYLNRHVASLHRDEMLNYKLICQFVEDWYKKSGFRWVGDREYVYENPHTGKVLTIPLHACANIFGKASCHTYKGYCRDINTRNRGLSVTKEPISEEAYRELQGVKLNIKILLNHAYKLYLSRELPPELVG